MKKVITYILMGAVILIAVLYGLSWIPREVNFTMSGELQNASTTEKTAETLTVSGKIYTPWLSRGMFEGNISFKNNTALSAEFNGKNTFADTDKNSYHISGGVGMKLKGNTYTTDVISDGNTRRILNIWLRDDDEHSVTADCFTVCENPEEQVSYLFTPVHEFIYTVKYPDGTEYTSYDGENWYIGDEKAEKPLIYMLPLADNTYTLDSKPTVTVYNKDVSDNIGTSSCGGIMYYSYDGEWDRAPYKDSIMWTSDFNSLPAGSLRTYTAFDAERLETASAGRYRYEVSYGIANEHPKEYVCTFEFTIT
ncbi:MAG: hypothetical protein IJ385_02265 [Ruminiclostridium sp.]|nr:hypothetical protein [Ruminiclostridium sp.]